jgi:MOSC domain-containing protein YiiM
MPQGRVHQISISPGGVPKLPVQIAVVTGAGLVGDGHNDTRHHGGPHAAVCLFSLEVIRRLREQGHPIGPGATGENVTLEGLDWPRVVPGCRLGFEGGVELEVTRYTSPCATIRDSFRGLEFRRIQQDLHPGESRVYARVLREGQLRTGERVTFVEPSAAAGDQGN